jgi:hypothetical protein
MAQPERLGGARFHGSFDPPFPAAAASRRCSVVRTTATVAVGAARATGRRGAVVSAVGVGASGRWIVALEGAVAGVVAGVAS